MTERILFVCSCCTLLQLIDPSILIAQGPPLRTIRLEEAPPTSPLEWRLQEPFRINASCSTLTDLVGRIRAMGIQCRVDVAALSDAGHAPGMRLHPSGTRTERLRDALEQLLVPEGLAYSVGPNTLTITTIERLEEQPLTVIYDTTPIVPEDGYFDDLINALTSTIAPHTWEEVGGHGSVTVSTVRGRTLMTVRQDERSQRQVASYLQAVQRSVSPNGTSARQASRTRSDRLPRTKLRRSGLPK